MKNIRLFLFGILMFVFEGAYSWGVEGHHMVADIAQKYCSKAVLDSVNHYLSPLSWEAASTWMDEMRSNPQFAYLKTWHYINLEKNETLDTNTTPKDNIVVQMSRCYQQLIHRKKIAASEISQQLKILIHLVADLHQPLHVGYGSDKGGNTIRVSFKNKKQNLHHLWDTALMEANKINIQTVLDRYKSISRKELSEIQKINILHWFTETRKHLDQVYRYKDPVDSEYILQSKSIIEQQLFNAGARLAALMESIFTQKPQS